MKIAILGDSWGVPNWYDPPAGVFWPAECHIQFLLQKLGHTVFNFSCNGGTNLQTLGKLQSAIESKSYYNQALRSEDFHEVYFDEEFDCDLIVWFFTEWIRDASLNNEPKDFGNYYFEDLEQQIINKTFSLAKKLKGMITAKWLIIGGQAPIPDHFDLQGVGDFILPDWKSSIISKQLPYVPFLTISDDHLRFIQSDCCKNSINDLEKLIEDVTLIRNELSNTSKLNFPDGGHPGLLPHRTLCDYIKTIL